MLQKTPRILCQFGMSSLVLLSIATSVVRADSCAPYEKLSRFIQEKVLPSSGSTLEQRAEELRQIPTIIAEISQSIYENYRLGRGLPISAENCLPSGYSDRIQHNIAAVFFHESIREMNESKSQTARSIAKLLLKKEQAGAFIPFTLTGHWKTLDRPLERSTSDQSPLETSSAGFHRAQAAVFANIAMIPHSDWLLVFAHEMIHVIDEQIHANLSIVANPDLARTVAQIANSKASINELTQDERLTCERFLVSALNRGFLAELRAWWLVRQIYHELHLPPIFWLEHLYAEGTPNKSTEARFVQALSERFPTSLTGLFGLPIIQALDANHRSNWIKYPRRVPWGSLKPLVKKL